MSRYSISAYLIFPAVNSGTTHVLIITTSLDPLLQNITTPSVIIFTDYCRFGNHDMLMCEGIVASVVRHVPIFIYSVITDARL